MACCGDEDMGMVLAHAAAARQRLAGSRMGIGDAGLVVDLVAHHIHQAMQQVEAGKPAAALASAR